ncbi:hypothetical protein [Amycolatopsis sp.]|uniref:hypothetical protein n=1 Tax=Amycolatopsis sp. TaxID=37632 RepID=UPI002C0674A3|nr:hypothetical protein [Amycolatopsis sp.]HVV11632.1 hypothetical protein [Amycolatopsis sp.]
MVDYEPPYVYGTSEELVRELTAAAEGWAHYGKPVLADEARLGAQEIGNGEPRAWVGFQEYVVTEPKITGKLP